ncbi:hypothetical protein GQ54DRAFT_309339 [Martensiomyces pterosporus]|nr:hypothetical protein GQ54DRAFT_309339 [Martensiomyces pterosporus]
MDQVTFHDSHVLLLTSVNYRRRLQGRLVSLGSGCPSTEQNKELDSGASKHQRRFSRRTVGLVRCGECPLSAMLQEASHRGVGGIVVTNAKACGRPTEELLQSTRSIGIPVAFISDRINKEILAIQHQIADLSMQEQASADAGAHRNAFVYVSVPSDVGPHGGPGVARILVLTYMLIAAVVLLTVVYFTLECSVGSLRNIPREIAPGIFRPRPHPVDEKTLDKLPLVPVEWDVALEHESDEESRQETPDVCRVTPDPAKQDVLRRLAGIIQNSGEGSYSFTNECACAICLDPYLPNESLRLLPCRHAFHQHCIDSWLTSEGITVHCPVCKSDIPDGLESLNKHGYGEVLKLLSGHPPSSAPTKPARLSVYFYQARNAFSSGVDAVCSSLPGLWRQER